MVHISFFLYVDEVNILGGNYVLQRITQMLQ